MAERGDRLARELVETAARDLAPELRRFLRSRYRLVSDPEDLVQETLSDLYRHLLGRDAAQVSNDELRALSFTILKNRVADRYRAEARAFAAKSAAGEQDIEAAAPSSERVAGYRELLTLVLGFMATMDESDRSLLWNEAVGSDRTAGLGAADRQRLSRLRARLRRLLLARGVSPQDMKEDSDD